VILEGSYVKKRVKARTLGLWIGLKQGSLN